MNVHPLDDIAAYATHALDETERRGVEAHLERCAECCRVLDAHHETLAQLDVPRPVPADVWQRIRRATSRRRGRPPMVLVAAALVVIVVGFAVAALRAPGGRDLGAEVEAALADPANPQAELRGPDERPVGTVVAVGETGYLRMDGIEALPADQSYQLWRLDGTEPVSLGLLSRRSDAMTVLALPTGTARLAVTVEPRRGSATPTGPVIARGSMG